MVTTTATTTCLYTSDRRSLAVMKAETRVCTDGSRNTSSACLQVTRAERQSLKGLYLHLLSLFHLCACERLIGTHTHTHSHTHTHTHKTQTRSWVREDEGCNIDVGEHSRHHVDDNGAQMMQGRGKAMPNLQADPKHTYTHIHTHTLVSPPRWPVIARNNVLTMPGRALSWKWSRN